MKKLNQQKVHIAVTGPDSRFPIGWWILRVWLTLKGVVPHYVTPKRPQVKHPVNGVIISGGDDIEPLHYGEDPRDYYDYDPARDALELSVSEQSLSSGIPTLGICRGAQIINIVQGGSLYGDISMSRSRTPKKQSIFPIKWAYCRTNTRLQRLLRKSSVKVNQLHHQAIKKLGIGVKPVATDADGFIQAIEVSPDRLVKNGAASQSAQGKNTKTKEERRNSGFFVGVQWHPEYLFYLRTQRRLIDNFIEAAKSLDKPRVIKAHSI